MRNRKDKMTFDWLVSSIQQVHDYLSTQAGKAVNISLTIRNWIIGLYIAEFEMHGGDRARYGDKLLASLADELEKLNISACGKRQLYQYLRFYQMYPQIVRSLTAQLHALVEYALAGMDNGFFVSKYQLELPKKEEMQKFIEEKMKEAGK